jgi:hypothetical protein
VNLKKLAVAAALALTVTTPAVANTATYSFGDLLGPGQSGPDDSSTWATLSVETISSLQYKFTLSLDSTNFTSLFGSSAAVFSAVFNTSSGLDPVSTSIDSGSWGVSNVVFSSTTPNPENVGFDFSECFGGNTSCNHGGPAGRLQAGESVSWLASFSSSQGDPLSFGSPAAALHVTSIGLNGDSAWYGPTAPIPEPETYALLLAGLGLMGFVARRRKAAVAVS